VSDPELGTPPAGEEIHLPAPSVIPLLSAVAITLIVVGTTISVVFIIAGVILFVATTVRWIRDVRRDVAALPDEHD